MRLTGAIKDAVINAILTETFKQRREEITSDKTKLAIDIYDDFYMLYRGDMARLPENFFIQSSTVSIRIEGGHTRHLTLPATRRFGKLHEYSFSFDKTHHFAIVLNEIQNRQVILDRDKDTLKDTLNRALRPVTTVKRLLEVWPSAEKYLPKEPVKTENLPAVKLDSLDTLIESMRGEKK